MKNAAVTALLLTIVAVGLWLRSEEVDAQPQHLSARIGAPNREKYRAIRDAKDWRNPQLVIRANGIEIMAEGVSKTVTSADLTRTLLGLPVTSWPYGRVVAVQEIGIREVDWRDEQGIKQNHEPAEIVLKKLGIDAYWWPSA